MYSWTEWEIDPKLLLKVLQANLINEGGDLLESVGGLGQVPGGVTVQVSQSEVVNLAQLSLWKKILYLLLQIVIMTYCDLANKSLASPNLLSSLNRSKRDEEVSQVNHKVSHGVDGVQVVLLVCGADVLKSGEGGPQLGEEGGHSGDGAGRLLQLGATLGTEDQLGGVGQLVHENGKTS